MAVKIQNKQTMGAKADSHFKICIKQIFERTEVYWQNNENH
jgi:hypothetical protein